MIAPIESKGAKNVLGEPFNHVVKNPKRDGIATVHVKRTKVMEEDMSYVQK